MDRDHNAKDVIDEIDPKKGKCSECEDFYNLDEMYMFKLSKELICSDCTVFYNLNHIQKLETENGKPT